MSLGFCVSLSLTLDPNETNHYGVRPLKDSQDFRSMKMGLLFYTSGGEYTPKGLLLLSLCPKDPLISISRAFQVLGKGKKRNAVVLFQEDSPVLQGQLDLKVKKINEYLRKLHLGMVLSNAASYCLKKSAARSSIWASVNS